jgi:hypothetical protein
MTQLPNSLAEEYMHLDTHIDDQFAETLSSHLPDVLKKIGSMKSDTGGITQQQVMSALLESGVGTEDKGMLEELMVMVNPDQAETVNKMQMMSALSFFGGCDSEDGLKAILGGLQTDASGMVKKEMMTQMLLGEVDGLSEEELLMRQQCLDALLAASDGDGLSMDQIMKTAMQNPELLQVLTGNWSEGQEMDGLFGLGMQIAAGDLDEESTNKLLFDAIVGATDDPDADPWDRVWEAFGLYKLTYGLILIAISFVLAICAFLSITQVRVCATPVFTAPHFIRPLSRPTLPLTIHPPSHDPPSLSRPTLPLTTHPPSHDPPSLSRPTLPLTTHSPSHDPPSLSRPTLPLTTHPPSHDLPSLSAYPPLSFQAAIFWFRDYHLFSELSSSCIVSGMNIVLAVIFYVVGTYVCCPDPPPEEEPEEELPIYHRGRRGAMDITNVDPIKEPLGRSGGRGGSYQGEDGTAGKQGSVGQDLAGPPPPPFPLFEDSVEGKAAKEMEAALAAGAAPTFFPSEQGRGQEEQPTETNASDNGGYNSPQTDQQQDAEQDENNKNPAKEPVKGPSTQDATSAAAVPGPLGRVLDPRFMNHTDEKSPAVVERKNLDRLQPIDLMMEEEGDFDEMGNVIGNDGSMGNSGMGGEGGGGGGGGRFENAIQMMRTMSEDSDEKFQRRYDPADPQYYRRMEGTGNADVDQEDEDDGHDGPCVVEGELYKQATNDDSWHRRYCVLNGRYLTYYRLRPDQPHIHPAAPPAQPIHQIKLGRVRWEKESIPNGSNRDSGSNGSDASFGFVLVSPNRQYRFRAGSAAERAKWIAGLARSSRAIQRSSHKQQPTAYTQQPAASQSGMQPSFNAGAIVGGAGTSNASAGLRGSVPLSSPPSDASSFLQGIGVSPQQQNYLQQPLGQNRFGSQHVSFASTPLMLQEGQHPSSFAINSHNSNADGDDSDAAGDGDDSGAAGDGDGSPSSNFTNPFDVGLSNSGFSIESLSSSIGSLSRVPETIMEDDEDEDDEDEVDEDEGGEERGERDEKKSVPPPPPRRWSQQQHAQQQLELPPPPPPPPRPQHRDDLDEQDEQDGQRQQHEQQRWPSRKSVYYDTIDAAAEPPTSVPAVAKAEPSAQQPLRIDQLTDYFSSTTPSTTPSTTATAGAGTSDGGSATTRQQRSTTKEERAKLCFSGSESSSTPPQETPLPSSSGSGSRSGSRTRANTGKRRGTGVAGVGTGGARSGSGQRRKSRGTGGSSRSGEQVDKAAAEAQLIGRGEEFTL